MSKDFNYIPEDDITINKKSFDVSYTFDLTNEEVKQLTKIQKTYGEILDKRKTALSSIIKTICYNTYLYINNMEKNTNELIDTISNKSYYKDIDPEFIDTLKNDELAQDFITELVRSLSLRVMNPEIIKSYPSQQKSFRLSKEDNNLLQILMGVRDVELREFIPSLIRFFLQSTDRVQFHILSYPSILIIERCIQEKKYILYDYKRIIPLKIVNEFLAINREVLIAYDNKNKQMLRIPLYISLKNSFLSIKETEQQYQLKAKEKNYIEAYLNGETIDVSFEIINNTPEVNSFLLKTKSYYIIKRHVNDSHVELTIKNHEGILDTIRSIEKAGDISNMTISDNYYDLLKFEEELKASSKKA